ncbi:MAG TPA: LysR substrate-binding domain-containing protein [Tahibacter sp.]|nr:LysR substrate-binding domain-containing protein [Tahibacter sp.]
MRDLNDLAFFVAVVDHGGFAAAGRALGIPKSRLSRRVALLEDDLGVRLVQRSTRRFAVTDIGQRFAQHGRAMLAEAQAAEEVVASERVEPRGLVRMSCAVEPAQTVLAPLLPAFLAAHPRVQVQLLAHNRRVDVIGEGIDVALRVRTRIDTDAELVVRPLGTSRPLLVASPAYLDAHGRPQTPADLAGHATLSMYEQDAVQHFVGYDDAGEEMRVEHAPRLRCGEFAVLLAAAIGGQGIVNLPEGYCAEAVARGELDVLLPHWRRPEGIVHIVYPSRRGVLPSVRALVDFLVEHVPPIYAVRRVERIAQP